MIDYSGLSTDKLQNTIRVKSTNFDLEWPRNRPKIAFTVDETKNSIKNDHFWPENKLHAPSSKCRLDLFFPKLRKFFSKISIFNKNCEILQQNFVIFRKISKSKLPIFCLKISFLIQINNFLSKNFVFDRNSQFLRIFASSKAYHG